MKLWVHVVRASGLRATDSNGPRDIYVRLQLGKCRAKTKVMKKALSPFWDEEFCFKVGDLSEMLRITVLAEDKYFNDDILGQVKIPLLKVFDGNGHSLAATWYPLHPKSKKLKSTKCGEVCLSVCLSRKNCEIRIISQTCSDDPSSSSDKSSELPTDLPLLPSNGDMESSAMWRVEETELAREEKSNASSVVDLFLQIFLGRNVDSASSPSRNPDSSQEIQDTSMKPEACENEADNACSSMTFDEVLRTLESKDQGGEMPENLSNGVLIDQYYIVSPVDLNSLLFSPNSNFSQSMSELQGTTNLQAKPWRLENGGETSKRVLTYIKAATKLIKAVKATEEQTYLKADGKSYAVLASVSIPDVPYGSYFKMEILYCISPGPVLPSEDQCSRLVVSWRINFLQSTMMKGMIENGAKQGLKESFAQFASSLSQNVKSVDVKDTVSDKEQILASLQTEQVSDWKLAFRFFGNFTAVSFCFVGLFVLMHILLANRSKVQGLEFGGLDLPDSIEELVVCGVLVLQGKRLLNMIGRFLQARKQRGSDHGVKANGDGWLLTVALIGGSSLAAADLSGLSDPYVVFTCNGKTKTSSIKFQTADPQWNEIFEFDAMNDPPSVMGVDVYDFDGPFDEATSLGHGEVNFVKSNISELADIWLPLQGKLAQACQSKLHLRIFLNNTRGDEVVAEYLSKMEKEVGKKLSLRSPQTNSAFQKLFCLPPEEFLISDYTCHLKRKMPLQGRLFLSPRIIGFYANLFGLKTKFFFLWEDVEDIQVIPPSLATMGSPSLMITLRKGRGMDAKHGAKVVDQDGRLKFHLQSFVSFHVANRTIMALWKARSLSPEQKVQIAEEESEAKCLQAEETASFLGIEDAKMSEVFSSALSLSTDSLMEIFRGGTLEQRIMEKVGCLDYTITPWEPVRPDVHQRQASYKFDRNLSRYGGEATSTQQKSPLPDKNGWVVEEVMTLQGVLLGDYFNLHLRYQFEDVPSRSNACNVQISLGVAWVKSTKHQKRIAKSVISKSSIRIKEMFRQVEKEFLPGK